VSGSEPIEFPEPAPASDPGDVLAGLKVRAYDLSDGVFEALALLPDGPEELLRDWMLDFSEQFARKLAGSVDVLGGLGTDEAA
jgi:hypothetical protein